jgi:hypothetical protein
MKKDQSSNRHHNGPVVILDIDYTVFTSPTFRRNFYTQLTEKLGYAKESEFLSLARKAEQQTKEEEGYFNPTVFLKHLKQISHTDVPATELEQILFDESLYIESVYEEARSLFQKLVIEQDIPVNIFSTGEKKFHKQKMDAFKEMLQEDQTHIEIVGMKRLRDVLQNYDGYHVYLVDDLPTILKEAKGLRSDITTIWVNKDKKTEKDFVKNFQSDYIIENLVEIATIVSEKMWGDNIE